MGSLPRVFLLLPALLLAACVTPETTTPGEEPYVLVLGTAQDGGFPQIGSDHPRARRAWAEPERRRLVAALLIVDPRSGQRWLIDATPDIDKWELWERSIEHELAEVDVALLDGTFFANGEIPGRDMSEIPHPFIEESLARFAPLPASERAKVRFTHLNHTNPATDPDGEAQRQIEAAGMSVATEAEVIIL